MLGDVPWYAWHVRWLPCEDITIGSQEVNELPFLFGGELGPNPHRLGWVSGVNLHCLGSLDWGKAEEVGLLQSGTVGVDDSSS